MYDRTLLDEILSLVKLEKDTTSKILKYLPEVDSRKLWLKEGYGSLFEFCTRHLKYSEPEAARRIHSARTLVKFPVIEPLIEKQELNLTTLSLLSPVLTESNHQALLEKAKNQSSRNVKKMIAAEFPEQKLPKEKLKPLTATDTLVQFLADEEMEKLIEQAKNQLRKKYPEGKLKDLFKEALKHLLATPKPRASKPRRHTRYVPKNIQREVSKRDGAQCTFKAPSGVRCGQKSYLEYDHVRPWGMGGSSHDVENIRLLCRAHNQYRAKDARKGVDSGML